MEELKKAVELVRRELDYIKNTCEYIYYRPESEDDKNYIDALKNLVNLAERVIEIGGKMPEKQVFGEDFDQKSNCDSNYVHGYNEAIDACTLAFAGMIPEKKESKHINCWEFDGDYCFKHQESIEDEEGHPLIKQGFNQAIDAILSAMKGGGE